MLPDHHLPVSRPEQALSLQATNIRLWPLPTQREDRDLKASTLYQDTHEPISTHAYGKILPREFFALQPLTPSSSRMARLCYAIPFALPTLD
jgi:hypothetical protein